MMRLNGIQNLSVHFTTDETGETIVDLEKLSETEKT